MFPDEFDYYRPDTVEKAIAILCEQEGAEVLAGGYSIVPSMKTGSAPSMNTGLDPSMKTGLASPDALVDIAHIDDLRGVNHTEESTSIGSLTRYATLNDDDVLWETAPIIAEAAGKVGTTQIRNRGTIGGNIAYADPASDLPGTVLAADATIVVLGPNGEREIAADDFFFGECETAIQENEIITSICVPHHGDDVSSAYVKLTSPSSGYAVVGVAVVLRTDGETVESARVAANGVMDRAIRISPAEEALRGASVNDDAALATAAECASNDLDRSLLLDDINASSEYRENLLETHTEKAIVTAVERLK